MIRIHHDCSGWNAVDEELLVRGLLCTLGDPSVAPHRSCKADIPLANCPDRGASDAKVALQYANIGLDLRGRSLVDDMAVVDDVSAACQRQSGGDVLLDQDDGLPSAGEVATGAHQV